MLQTRLDPAITAFYGLPRRTTRGGSMNTAYGTIRCAQSIGAAVALLATGLLAGCAVNDGAQISQGQGMQCLDDSPSCITQRQAALRHMVARTDRHWVREPASVTAYASGVRLFAFKTKKKELSCDELQIGRREADGAGKTLRGPDGRGLSPAQISRGAMLGEEVSRELSREISRRCGRG